MKTRRLLLIAMSGVRVHDPELRALGLTLPGFVERGNVIASLPSLSLLTLAGHTPDHWEVEYLEADALDASGAPEAVASRGRFDLVAISSLSARIFDAYALADQLRELGLKVVIGGLHASALPQEALNHADAVVQGEGERIWPELLSDYEEGRLRPIYSSLSEPRWAHRMEDARVPRYDLLDIERYNRLTLQTTRGCPLDCSFCGASRTISGYKRKPLSQVRRELEAILSLWPRPFLELADDNTFVSREWSRELVTLLNEYDIRWFTETDIRVADDERLLESLARSGCAELLIGLEAIDSRTLSEVDGQRFKARHAREYLERIRRIQSWGIAVNGCFVFGFDDQDASVFERTREFVEESGLCDVQITLLTPFPGTKLARTLKAEGRLLREVYWDQCTLFDLTFQPKRMSAQELQAGFRQLMTQLYGEESTSRRKSRLRRLSRTRSQLQRNR
ncbi:MAG: cobalamin-dependent protein [Myxococcaceae bacterium]